MFHVLIRHVMRQLMCRRNETMCGSSQKQTEAILPVLLRLAWITSWSFTRTSVTSPPSSFLSLSLSLHLADAAGCLYSKQRVNPHSGAAAALRRQIPRRAALLPPHKACQTGWMEERLLRASKPAASSFQQHGQLQTRCASNPGIRTPWLEHLTLGSTCWPDKLWLCF